MANWFSERFEALEEAEETQGAWRLLVAFAIFLGSLVLDWLRSKMEGGMIWGLPIWVYGAIVALFFVAWWLLEYAVRLRRKLQPIIKLDFLPNEGGMVITPENKIEMIAQVGLGGTINPIATQTTGSQNTTFIRVRVDCLSSVGPRVCAAFLTRLEKITSGPSQGQVARLYDGMQLPWSFLGPPREIPIHPKITRHIDVFRSTDEKGILEICGPIPLAMVSFLEDVGDYIAEVTVIADGVPSSIRIRVIWNGNWNEIKADKAI